MSINNKEITEDLLADLGGEKEGSEFQIMSYPLSASFINFVNFRSGLISKTQSGLVKKQASNRAAP